MTVNEALNIVAPIIHDGEMLSEIQEYEKAFVFRITRNPKNPREIVQARIVFKNSSKASAFNPVMYDALGDFIRIYTKGDIK